MRFKYQWISIMVLVFFVACGGGGDSGSGSSAGSGQQLAMIATAAKAENIVYEISQNTSDFFAITGWSEMVLEAFNNQLVEPENKIENSPYKDVNLTCPKRGMMTVNGSVTLNGSRSYDIALLLDNCYFTEQTGLSGEIRFKGTSSDDKALEMEVVMKDFRIGVNLLKETMVNANIKVANGFSDGDYQMTLNGTVSDRKEEVKYTDFLINIEQNINGEPQTLEGSFELTKSDTPCVVGKYDVSTITKLTDSGIIKVNDAIFTYNKDNTVDIDFTGGSVKVTGEPKLSCE